LRLSLELGPTRLAARKLTLRLRNEQRYDDALEVWQEMAAALPPQDPDHWWALGRAAEMERNWAQAADAFGHGAQRSEDPYDFWIERGRNFQRLQDWERARRAYWQAFLLHVPETTPSNAVGNAYLQQGEYAQAGRWFGMAFYVNPRDVSSNYHLAQVLHSVGEEEVAVTFLARAIELNPRQRWGWAVQLGDWRLALGDREGALEAYRQALEWRPGEASIEERIEQAMED
jgi:tetratricopeptide (TPR) repeat protein